MREYSGAALSSFIVGLSEHQAVVDKLVADSGVDRIDPEAWYDIEWAFDLFNKIEKKLGRAAVIKVGRSMTETAVYPPEVDSAEKILSGVGSWWALNARGPGIGTITCEWEDEHSAVIECTAYRNHCTLMTGILEGACMRYGITPLVEHGPGSCIQQETGDMCVYRVSW
ncbi:hypothetical protein DB30_06447 [Enhygromyxa salina]|uniref:V4R domain protein n=2 Tax=Enhygromyxa salina TaxID=215803 RepID=A0A0C2CUA7_9BACT|nr:hypothetical protein DB30_06447 [Enhygromyxa salina]